MKPVPSGDDVPVTRRAQSRRYRRQWRRFGIAVGVTVALVVVFGAGPLELTGGEGRFQAAASIRTLGDDSGLATTTTTTQPWWP